VADAVRRLRHHGITTDGSADIPVPGFNYRLADVLCALGIPQLERLDELLDGRERVAALYEGRLRDAVGTPSAADGDRHGWQAFVVRVDNRDRLLTELREDGIEVQIGTYALHRLGAYRDHGPLPGASRAYEHALALPFAATTTEEEVDRVCDALLQRL
jgi:dTDP-4-amino-4,6-dideoxygalactose transaminase